MARQVQPICREAGVLLVEAFVFLFHPQTLKLRQLLDDGVIDPIDTRRWITTIFDGAPETHRAATDPMAPPRRPNIDTW